MFHNAPPINIGFRGARVGDKWDMWSHLCLRLMDVTLTDVPGRFVWSLNQNGMFTVKSMYEDLMDGHTRFLRTCLWNLKIQLKIKVFMWFLDRKVLLMKDNLAKRKWHGDSHCSFCGNNESIDHLFISCPFCKTSLAHCVLYL